jgi:hypothetical protein
MSIETRLFSCDTPGRHRSGDKIISKVFEVLADILTIPMTIQNPRRCVALEEKRFRLFGEDEALEACINRRSKRF